MSLFAIVILGALIFFHELGHFLVAKLCGVGVVEFAVGFGPKLLTTVYHNTRYSIRLIPLGGYVKMAGETQEAVDDQSSAVEVLEPHEVHHLDHRPGWFIHKPLAARAATVFAGPLFNFIFAYVLAILVLVQFGVAKPTDSTVIGDVIEKYPAALAGVHEGDQVLKINDVTITAWPQIREQVLAIGDSGSIQMTVLRDGQEMTFDLRSKEIGGEVDYLMGSGKGDKSFMIGVSQKTDIEKVSLSQSFSQAGFYVAYLSYMNVKSIWGLLKGMISPEHLGGPISIMKEAAKSASSGLEKTLNFMIFLNVGLAVLNLLPIPVLDGGHLLFFLIEAVRGKPLGLRAQEYASRVGMFALLALMLYALTNDIRGLF